MSTKPQSWSLTAKSSQSGLQPQRPRFSIGFRQYRKALTIKQKDRLLKTHWQLFAFSREMSWVLPTGKRSSHTAVRDSTQSDSHGDPTNQTFASPSVPSSHVIAYR